MLTSNYTFLYPKNYLYSKPVKGLEGYGVGYGFGSNGKEKDNLVNGEGNAYDFGARIYDSRLGKLISVDKMHKLTPNWTPYRFAFNNPIRVIDKDGNYESDAHYWTVYMVGLMIGLTPEKAKEIAYNTEKWDTEIHDNYATLQYTWMDKKHQHETHALTGGNFHDELYKTAVDLYATNPDDIEAMGRLLHRLGDCFAHSKMDASYTMYGNKDGSFTTENYSKDKSRPDKIVERPVLYIEYVKILSMVMADKYNGSIKKLDIDKFNKLVAYAKAQPKPISLIGIMNYEVAKMQNQNSFVVQFAAGSVFVQSKKDHKEHLKNTENYLKSMGVTFEKTELKDSKNNYTGTKYTITGDQCK